MGFVPVSVCTVRNARKRVRGREKLKLGCIEEQQTRKLTYGRKYQRPIRKYITFILNELAVSRFSFACKAVMNVHFQKLHSNKLTIVK
jgi:hypothetical protein